MAIVHHHSQLDALFAPTIQLTVNEKVTANVVEIFFGGAESLAVPSLNVTVAAGAKLDYSRWQKVEAAATQLGVLSATLHEDSIFKANCITHSGDKVRLDAEVNVMGERAEAELNGLSLVEVGQQTGLYYRVNHMAGNAKSNQTVRVVVNNKAKHVYDGYIYVAHGANGTDARQSSKALLLSKRAQALANPRLEILTDDVSCAHGATIGFLDTDAMFYLRSRGVPESQAQAILVEGFTAEALQSISTEPLKQAIEAHIQQHYQG